MYCVLVVIGPGGRQRACFGLRRIAAMRRRATAKLRRNRPLRRREIGASIVPTQPRRCSMPSVNPIPDGYRSLTPYLIVADGAGAVVFYEAAFGARVRLRLDRPDRRDAALHGQKP